MTTNLQHYATQRCSGETSDLLGSDQLDKFSELRASASVNTKHTLLMHRQAVQLQWNLVLGITTHHQNTTLHGSNTQSYSMALLGLLDSDKSNLPRIKCMTKICTKLNLFFVREVGDAHLPPPAGAQK